MGTTATDDRLATVLRAGGHRMTSQRLVLHRVLAELGRHASAEEIARASAERLPGLSLPTVYATLELFEDLGLVRRVDAGGPAAARGRGGGGRGGPRARGGLPPPLELAPPRLAARRGRTARCPPTAP